MESDRRYYERRAAEERKAAARAITPEGRHRHDELAALFAAKAEANGEESQAQPVPSTERDF